MPKTGNGPTRQVLDEQTRDDLLELAWIVIANVGGGDWSRESAEWQSAAADWREDYFRALRRKDTEPEPAC